MYMGIYSSHVTNGKKQREAKDPRGERVQARRL